MTREDILKEILKLKGSNWLLELATGTGKSRMALEKLKRVYIHDGAPDNYSLLIVVPRNVHKKNWEEEIKKWWPHCTLNITYTTYVSFPKYKGNWNICIFDEVHHLSERCREALCDFEIKHSVLCSATVNKSLKDELNEVFDKLVFYKRDLRDVIDNNILPDPKVFLIPIELNTLDCTESIWKNKNKSGKLIECSWNERWKYIKQTTYPVRICCTERQFITDLDNQIDYWKKRYLRSNSLMCKNKWLKLCSERLKWLSDKKTQYIHNILNYLQDYRTLTFCNNIKQTEEFGKYCINSKNTESEANILKFNNGEINHITACNMLNEGMNLINCQVGIYANLNSSEIIIKQRMGRILRHNKPILIVPYYKNTREEELVNKMISNYNKELIKTITTIKDLENEL